ncbi:MAG: phosphate acyltransferase [Proteobacteria bacterium]|nr:phosphate acyltransferase [Pseudomonadota bacterium]
MRVSNFDELIQLVKQKNVKDGGKKKVAVMCADDEEVLAALVEARDSGIADSFLVGNKANILKAAKEGNIDISGMEIIDEPDVAKAGEICTGLVNSGKASVMMKGLVSSSDYMRAILNKEKGLRSGKLLSHVALYDLPTYHKFLVSTDGGVNIRPTLDEKISIIQNAVGVLSCLGVKKPKVAAICAVETVNPEKMPATVDAQKLSIMAKEGKLGEVYVDGPFALDVAISKHAAKIKKLDHLDVPGDADIILADDIESGNMIYKALCNFGQGRSSAIVAGAKAPLVLTSRSDTHESKYLSIVLAIASSCNI